MPSLDFSDNMRRPELSIYHNNRSHGRQEEGECGEVGVLGGCRSTRFVKIRTGMDESAELLFGIFHICRFQRRSKDSWVRLSGYSDSVESKETLRAQN